ncbi:uncharacterized protein AKAME5_002090300 [Lates japonicus]|uniref:Uncharacterized protein n=1 Tax=Lates japonicus TaxID=270547 RepID=A0AAD3NE73_LATJO|nr:uncharacterized protein AKAME5_002090300 [Lates japonicus]
MTAESRFCICEDLLQAEPVTEFRCSGLDICHQHPESFSPTLRETKTLSIWKNLERKQTGMDLKSRAAAILREKEEEKCCSARRAIQEILPNKSTTKIRLFQDDIFHNQRVHVGDCCLWSRYLVAETRGPAKISADPTQEQTSLEKIRPTGQTTMEVHLRKTDLEKAERERQIKVQQEREEVEVKIYNVAQEEICTPLPMVEEIDLEELQELQNLHQTWQNITQTEELDEFEDVAVLAVEKTEEVEEPKKDKSVRRCFLNWLNDSLEDRYKRKIARTYVRELEEGDQIYRSFFMGQPKTRAERERQKRQCLIYEDKQRQGVKKLLDAYWMVQRQKKELLKFEEEERYKKWATKHGLSIPDSLPQQAKKRMSKSEERLLIVKQFFH